MINRMLIIAPHPDDEINLAGQLIIRTNKIGIETFVVYTNNGDAESKIGNKRITEAIVANKVLGIDEEHVIFLGYPNEWEGKTHLYNASDDEELISRLGKTETNSVATHPEFCFMRRNKHHKFTRRNFKQDLKEIIDLIRADLLIAPEFDSNPDHRATSLIFDEIMGEILRENLEYRPIIFKKYIHEGVWYGPKDYYQMLPTMTEGPREYAGGMHDLDSPCFKWDERLSILAESETSTPLLKDNIVYQAAQKHKVTTAWYEMQRVINADSVYWYRRTDNLVHNALINVSSGDGSYLSDLKYYDCDDVYETVLEAPLISSYCWVPEINDKSKTIEFLFEGKQQILIIKIYEAFDAINHIKKVKVESDNTLLGFFELDNSGAAKIIMLSQPIVTNRIRITILEYEGIPGISEIEIYSNNEGPKLGMEIFSNYKKDVVECCSFAQRLESLYFKLLFLFTFKLRYELNKYIKQ